MRTFVTATVLALGIGATGGLAHAADSTSSQHSMKGSSSTTGMQEKDARKLNLKVKEIDKQAHKVTFEAPLKAEANITGESGKAMTIEDLKEGDQVRASFDSKTGDIVKLEIMKNTGSMEKGMDSGGSKAPMNP